MRLPASMVLIYNFIMIDCGPSPDIRYQQIQYTFALLGFRLDIDFSILTKQMKTITSTMGHDKVSPFTMDVGMS